MGLRKNDHSVIKSAHIIDRFSFSAFSLIMNDRTFWEVDIVVASIRVGFDLLQDDLPSLFGDKVISFDNGDKWFIPDFIDYQYGELNQNSNVHQSVINLLNKYNLEGYLKGSQRVESTLKDKDTDIVIVKEKVKAKRFSKPTIEDIKEYCIERNNFVDAEKFFDYYSSNGWKVGKNPMKDWKASVRTWEKNSTSEQSKGKVQQSLDTWQEARQMINNG